MSAWLSMVTGLEASALALATVQTAVLVEIARRLGHIKGVQEQIKRRIGVVEERQQKRLRKDDDD